MESFTSRSTAFLISSYNFLVICLSGVLTVELLTTVLYLRFTIDNY